MCCLLLSSSIVSVHLDFNCVAKFYHPHYNNYSHTDIEIQPGFEPGSSECQSDALTT